MRKSLIILPVIFLFQNSIHAQVWSNNITAPAMPVANPFTSGDIKDPNITVSGIGLGSGLTQLTGTSSGNKYGATGWPSGSSIGPNDYFYFTMTPNNGYSISITNFNFTTSRTFNGPTKIILRSSEDNFTNDLYVEVPITTAAASKSVAINKTYTDPVTFRIYANTRELTSGSGSLFINDFSFTGSVSTIPLPLNLLSFDAKASQNKVILEWRCANQKSLTHFVIERSADGGGFQTAGIVKARNIAEEMTYTFSEALPATAGNLLYRLKIYETDESYNYSPVAALNTATKGKTDIYPNPFKDRLVLKNIPKNSNISAQDIYGRVIWQSKSINSEVNIDTRSWRNSIYFIRINDNLFTRVIKQ